MCTSSCALSEYSAISVDLSSSNAGCTHDPKGLVNACDDASDADAKIERLGQYMWPTILMRKEDVSKRILVGASRATCRRVKMNNNREGSRANWKEG